MATHSSILAWRIPWTEEPDSVWSMGSQSDLTERLTYMHVHALSARGSALIDIHELMSQ